MAEVEVEVLTKQGCHLCADALQITAEACAELGVQHREVDITDDAELLSLYAEELPVLRIDGAVRDFWRFEPQRLRRLIREAQRR